MPLKNMHQSLLALQKCGGETLDCKWICGNKWIFQGERVFSRNTQLSRIHDDIDGLLHGTFWNIEGETSHGEGEREGLSKDAKRFLKLLNKRKKSYIQGVRTSVSWVS